MKTQLFSITSFEAVAPGATVIKPHGLNKNDGTPIVPDEIKRRTEGSFTVTADDTNITVENKGAAAANIDILAERWHSIERQLGKGDYGVSNLPIQPWETEGVAADDELMPLTAIVWSPNNPGGTFGNVYDTWDGAYNAAISVGGQGFVYLFCESKYSVQTLIDGSPVAVVPDGEWDMKGIIPMNKRVEDGDWPLDQVAFAEDAFWDHCNTMQGNGLSFVQRSGVTTSPIRLGDAAKTTEFTLQGVNVTLRQEDDTAAPLIECTLGSQKIKIDCAGDATFCSIGDLGTDSPSPIVDVNGQTVEIGSGGMQIQNNCLVDSEGTGTILLNAHDDAAMVGGLGTGANQANDYEFPAIPADTTKFLGNTFSRNRVMPTTELNMDGVPVPDVKTSDYEAHLGEQVPCNTQNGSLTVWLPKASPSPGEICIVTDVGGFAGHVGQEIRVATKPNDRNPGGAADTILGALPSFTIGVPFASLQFRSSGNGNWTIV